MAANIFQVEANDIRNYLERHGYVALQGSDHIIVKDPVQCSSGKGTERTEYKDVVIRNWPDAVTFVDERS